MPETAGAEAGPRRRGGLERARNIGGVPEGVKEGSPLRPVRRGFRAAPPVLASLEERRGAMSAVPDALPAGFELEGCRIEAVLGADGDTVTYAAHEVRLGSDVVIEELFPSFVLRGAAGVAPRSDAFAAAWEKARAAFLRYAQQLIRLNHRGLPSSLHYFEQRGTAYLLQRRESHQSLAVALTQSRLSFAHIAELAEEILHALEALHAAGLVHGNLSPETIQIRSDGLCVLTRIAGWRVGMPADDGGVLANPYRAPELATPGIQAHPAIDFYALGAVLYRVIGGVVPPSAHERLQGVGVRPVPYPSEALHLRAAIEDAFALDPNLRPQSAAAFRQRMTRPVWSRRRGVETGAPVDTAPRVGASGLPASLAAAVLARRRDSRDPPTRGGPARRRSDRHTGAPASEPIARAGGPPPAYRAEPKYSMSGDPRRRSYWPLVVRVAATAGAVLVLGLLGLKLAGLIGMTRAAGRGETREEDESPPTLTPVNCSVFAPPEVARGEQMIVQVFVHPPAEDSRIAEAAGGADPAAARRGFASLSLAVPLGTRLSFGLSAPGLEVVDGAAMEIVWHNSVASVQFLLAAPVNAALGHKVATVRAAIDGVPAGLIRFVIEVKAAGPSAAEPRGSSARRYDKAFISYAWQDRAEVLKRVQMLRRVGIDFYQDVLDVEPGEQWIPTLYREIDSSDLFLLFWSSKARDSEWVKKEVLHALARQGGDPDAEPEIVPVLLEGPPPVAPPPELAHLHFNVPILYFIAGSERR